MIFRFMLCMLCVDSFDDDACVCVVVGRNPESSFRESDYITTTTKLTHNFICFRSLSSKKILNYQQQQTDRPREKTPHPT